MPDRGFGKGFILIGIIVAMVACKTQNVAVEVTKIEDSAFVSSELSGAWMKDFRSLKILRIDGELNINGNIQRVKGNIALQRDSLIVISVIPVLGYEVLRILCTPDSIIVINRQEKSYTLSSLEKYRIKNHIPVGFRDIQAMIASEVFYYKDQLPGRSYARSVEDSAGIQVLILESDLEGRKLTRQTVRVGKEGPERILIMDYEEKMKVSLSYDDYLLNGDMTFPGKALLVLLEPRNSIELQLNYGEVIFNEPVRAKFQVPHKYFKAEM